jgi:hypothetical protein
MSDLRYTVRTPAAIFFPLLLTMAGICTGQDAASPVTSIPGASVLLRPTSLIFDRSRVPEGAVGFTASIRNEGTTTIRVAHPSICVPAGYTQGDRRRINDSHGESEILLTITRPDGTTVVLRDGHMHYFDPDNVPLLTIPPKGIGTFHVGWFFQNARGRWERDDEAAEVFLLKGKYRIRLMFRNAFPRGAVYDDSTKALRYIEVWTGEMESPEITIEVR